jgi:hypothetical protein
MLSADIIEGELSFVNSHGTGRRMMLFFWYNDRVRITLRFDAGTATAEQWASFLTAVEQRESPASAPTCADGEKIEGAKRLTASNNMSIFYARDEITFLHATGAGDQLNMTSFHVERCYQALRHACTYLAEQDKAANAR